MNIQTRIDKARWWALTHQPFYGALAMRLPDVIDPSTQTAHTTGREIAWNPQFVESLTDEELRFVLLHETLHCAHQHMWRLPPDEAGNIAGDHEINLTLQAIQGISMPEGGLADPQYAGLACEEILGRLSKSEPPQPDSQPEPGEDEDESEPDEGDDESQSDQGGDEDGDGDGDSDGDSDGDGDEGDDQSQGGASQSGQGQPQQGGKPDPCGSFGAPTADPSGPGDAEAQAQADKELREMWDGAVIQAAQAAQALGQGDIPADLQRVLDRIRHQSVDWKREMADFVKVAMSTRNDWSRSSRRMATAPVIYPRKRIDDMGTVIFARDTSGSINDEICAAFTALITECISETGCTGLVIDCDATIQAEYELQGWDDCPLTASGGGGTDFRPVFARADELVEQGERVAGIVYLTDLLGPAPADSEIPTLWLSTTKRDGPFGRTVLVEV